MSTYNICFHGEIRKTFSIFRMKKSALSVAMLSQTYQVILLLKGTIFLENRHFFIQEKLNKLIYSIYKIIKCSI